VLARQPPLTRIAVACCCPCDTLKFGAVEFGGVSVGDPTVHAGRGLGLVAVPDVRARRRYGGYTVPTRGRPALLRNSGVGRSIGRSGSVLLNGFGRLGHRDLRPRLLRRAWPFHCLRPAWNRQKDASPRQRLIDSSKWTTFQAVDLTRPPFLPQLAVAEGTLGRMRSSAPRLSTRRLRATERGPSGPLTTYHPLD
jgi:hypothetical protein